MRDLARASPWRYGHGVFERRLVTLVHRDGAAAVVRDWRRRIWLGDPRPGTMLEGFEPGVQGLASDVTLAGGLLPPRAVAAVVHDRAGRPHDATCANGAWLALLPEPVRGEPPVVRFLDERGELVAVPVPAGVTLETVSDATEPCPVCRATDWARVVAAPRGRYGEDSAGRPTAAVCRRCGYVEALGVLFAPLSSDPSTDRGGARTTARIAREMTAVARSARFQLYGLVGLQPTVSGYASHDADLDSVSLAFDTPAGPVTVDTSIEHGWGESKTARARQALEGLLDEPDGSWPERSETATLLWLNARHRKRAADAAAAPVQELDISINDAATAFITVAYGERFAAAGNADDVAITISGQGDPTCLAIDTLDPSTL